MDQVKLTEDEPQYDKLVSLSKPWREQGDGCPCRSQYGDPSCQEDTQQGGYGPLIGQIAHDFHPKGIEWVRGTFHVAVSGRAVVLWPKHSENVMRRILRKLLVRNVLLGVEERDCQC
jgi:hypothetical protein